MTELLAKMPPDFTFTAIPPALALGHIARLQWRSGRPDGPAAVTGPDVGHFEDGRIRALYVFLDQPGTQVMVTSPIRIGHCLSLTGPLAGNSRSARPAPEN